MNASGSMETVASRAPGQTKRGKSRRSRARGLRTSTGCLTCRKRRVKCDECRPRCGQCSKGERECHYWSARPESSITNDKLNGPSSPSINPPEREASDHPPSSASRNGVQPPESSASSTPPHGSSVFTREDDADRTKDRQSLSFALFPDLNNMADIPDPLRASIEHQGNNSIETEQIIRSAISPLVQGASFSASPGAAPFDWYQLLAQDALSNIDEYLLLAHESNWDFDPSTLLQGPSYGPHSSSQNTNDLGTSNPDFNSSEDGRRLLKERYGRDEVTEPWNTTDPLVLEPGEAIRFQHFTKSVGPILDFFDPFNHFSDIVPHLALRNIGLMKSMLAVAARHLSLVVDDGPGSMMIDHQAPPSFTNHQRDEKNLSMQYYYETLCYLSQAMQYPSYTRSTEILATAIMISTYEMFDDDSSDWERHLRGAFWIQRNQDNDGESNGLQKAVWWAWLRQDIWAAFRHKRRTMTIWRPTKPLNSLGPDELACRSMYLLAKAIEYISEDHKRSQDLAERIEEGEMHIRSLEDWYTSLPVAFSPIPIAKVSDSIFKPIWIHPPHYSASVQLYCFAKIVILVNMPSTGGIHEYHERQKTLEDAVSMICGLAQAPGDIESSRAFISVQCLFVAGQCTRAREKQDALLQILEGCMSCCKWLQSPLVNDLKAVWSDS